MGNAASDETSEIKGSIPNSQFLRNQRGGNIFIRHFMPDTTPQALVFYFHGLFLHCSVPINVEVCQNLARSGKQVVSFDMTGHGRSANDSTRGTCESWKWFIDDALEVILHTIKSTTLPFFLFGISLGGCVALHTSLKLKDHLGSDQLKRYLGTLLFAPAISCEAIKPQEFVLNALHVLNEIGFGNFGFGPSATQDQLGGPEGYARFKNDKYCYSAGITLNMGESLLNMTDAATGVLSQVDFPFYLAHGIYDSVVDIRGSRDLFKQSKTPQQNKIYFEDPHASHDIFTPATLKGAEDWMSARLQE